MKNIFIILFIAICSTAILNSCGHSTNPEDTLKDPREMTWTVDTIQTGDNQTTLGKFTALNSKFIYTYGHCSDPSGGLYLYDGVSWKLKPPPDSFAKMIAFSQSRIFGFSEDRNECAIYFYNGASWNQVHFIDRLVQYTDATTDGVSKIWACGSKGLLSYYDGTKWTSEYISIGFPQSKDFFLSAVGYHNNKLVFTASSWNENNMLWRYYVEKEGNNYLIKDSAAWFSYENKWGNRFFYNSSWGAFYSYGEGGMWKMSGDRWIPFDAEQNSNDAILSMYGISENYYYLCKNINKIAFCNGGEQILLNDKINLDYNKLAFYNIWTDGKEVFIGGYTLDYPEKTIIIHGK